MTWIPIGWMAGFVLPVLLEARQRNTGKVWQMPAWVWWAPVVVASLTVVWWLWNRKLERASNSDKRN